MRSKEALQRRILELCDENRLSLNALSIRCGIRQSTLNNIVNGRNNSVTIETVARICEGLNMDLYTFFDSDLFRDLEQEIY
ncbi:MAG: helix-turn-helix transcriptional regulator [Firmicutes bacterium]|nr:helix-turn-helix transcriptional regulator [Bacillota bacterium]